MENKKILESNLLIAVFMGWKIDNSFPDKDRVYRSPSNDIELTTTFKFDSDWKLLMDVVETIEKMDYGFKMCRKVVEVYVDSTKEVILKTKESCRMESLYKAVVEFIEWYNQQTK